MSGPLSPLLTPVTRPAAYLYSWAIDRRNHRFDRGKGIKHVDVPVISVGNITTGGSGKTPMVAWIVQRLRDAGHVPLIAMRGYGATADEPSDEQAEYADLLPETPVVAQPDRTSGIRRAMEAGVEFDCVVLDDGFQHRQLHRDVDLVLIDATRPELDGRVLPAGWLREPIENLRRADAVIVTRAKATDETLTRRIADAHGRPPIAWAKHAWIGLEVVAGRNDTHGETPDWLENRSVVTLLGVGNPTAVTEQIRAHGARIVASIPASDHERYDRRFLSVVAERSREADAVVMTRKDWVKVRRVIDWSGWTTPIVVPRLSIDVWSGAEPLLDLMRLKLQIENDPS